ncbi:MAG: regulatory protein LuxR [Xanthobacteraceae bacterium]|nr:MAG: regulatory protein LuxR [Xanthobacteraceae bacterium]
MGSIPNPEDVVSAVYEAAVLPELWTSALDAMAGLAACEAGVLIASDGSPHTVIAANRLGMVALEKYNQGNWAPRNTQGPRTLAHGEPAFISDYDIFTPEEVETDAFYRDFLRPTGLAWGCGTAVQGPTQNRIIISLHRRFEFGPLSTEDTRRMTALRPAIARGVFLASRLRLREARNAVDALEMVGLPAAALTATGKISAANQSFSSFVPRVALDHRDRIRLVHPGADHRLAEAIARRVSTGQSHGRTIAIPGDEGEPPHTVHLIPVAGQAHDIFSALSWLLLVVPVVNRPGVSLEVLRGLFDLSPAEARVSKGILNGDTPGEIASKLGLSPETVRTQLKAVFSKMGVSRQADVVRLLTGLPVFDSD